MGSPLDSVLANRSMCDFEGKGVRTSESRPSAWFRYVHDTFGHFSCDRKSASQFLKHLNSHHIDIKFTIDFEENSEISFLDILGKRCPDNAFMASIYRKKTFTDLYTKWNSFTPRKLILVSNILVFFSMKISFWQCHHYVHFFPRNKELFRS